MADSIIQLPYTATTSGDILDAGTVLVGAQTVKRERMVLGNDSSSHVAIVTTSGALTVTRSTAVSLSSAPTVAISSGLITLSSAPTINVSSGIVTLSSAVGISSGLVTVTNPSTAVTVTNPSTAINLVGTSNAIAPATSSGGLLVTFTNSVSGSTVVSLSSAIAISSGLITLSSAISLSSGIVTLSSPISLSSGLVTLTGTNVVTNASSGFVQVYQSTSPWLTALSSAITASIVSSGGIYAPVTSSAGLLVNASITGGAGSTAVSIFGSSGAFAQVTSSGGMWVQLTNSGGAGSTSVSIEGAAGVEAPVSSSAGLMVSAPTRQLTHLLSTPTVVTLFQITTAPAVLYSITVFTTQTTLSYMEFYANGSTALNVASTFLISASPIVVGAFYSVFNSNAGVACTGGLTAVSRVTIGSTVGTVVTTRYNIEYSV